MSFLLPAAAATIIVVIQLVSGATGVMVRDPATPPVLRRAGWFWRLGMLAGLAVLALLATFTPFGPRAYGVAPALAGTAFVLAIALGEVTWPKPEGPVRTAQLGPSRPPAPRRLAVAFVASLLSAVALGVAGGVTAASDGRSVELHWPTGGAGAGPYPGWYYLVPMGAGLAVLAASTWWSLRRIDARAALGAEDRHDDRLARTAAKTRVLRGALAAVLLTLGGTALVMGGALHGLWQTAQLNHVTEATDANLTAIRWAGLGLAVAGLVALLAALVVASRTGASAWHARRREQGGPATPETRAT